MLAWRPFRLAVNVSASQVGPDFDGWVKGVLADAELPAEYLEIELTESVAFGDPAIFPALDAMRQIGVRFAADDFGTGYSLRQAGCDTVQGFLFARPMPAAAFVGFVNQWRNTTMNANEPSTSCCVCCKEIPLDAAFTPEGAEYVEHFCGLECYQRFEARAKTGNETDADPNACDSLPSD